MAGSIREWLRGMGLEQYATAFEENDLTVDLAEDLTDQDLRDLGVASMGHRKTLARAIAALKDGAPPAPRDTAARDRTNDVSARRSPREPGPQSAAPLVDRRQLTVMFCDLAGSTALSSRLDPEDYREVIRTYQDSCAGIISRYDGYVAKFMGDGVLAYFGWPRSHEDDAERAIAAGLGVANAIRAIPLPNDGVDPLTVRVGIATGPVVVGDIVGEGAAQEAAATGETLNLAARLQEVAPANAVMISAATRALVGDLFQCQQEPSRVLKGIGDSVEIWRAVGEKGVESRFDAVRGQSLTRFIGRDHELALLRDRWDAAADGEGQVVLLSGEAGIGKSRLMNALMDDIGDEPHFRLRFQCSPYHANSVLHPMIRQLERAARFEPADSSEARLEKLEAVLGLAGVPDDRTVSLVANLLSVPFEARYGALDLTPQQIKHRTLEVLSSQVYGLARKKPVLFLFEDAHWIDPTSLELLELTVPRASTLPVMFLITHRPEWHPPFANQAHTTLLPLSRLGRRPVAEIVRSVADNDVPNAIIERIVERTDGIPLFVEEMTRSLLEGGFAAAENADNIPDTLQASLTARLDHLPAHAKELAQIASVIGREVGLSLLTKVTGCSDSDNAGAVGDLIQSQLMVRGGSSGDDQIVFRHALIRDAAYQSLLTRRRRDIHRKIARTLESDFPNAVESEPELLATHFAEAGDTELAIAYWRRAGERASLLLANNEAIDHYRNALAQLYRLPEGLERDRTEAEIMLAMGVPLIAATGYASTAVRDNYTRARALSENVNDLDCLFTSTRGLWNCVFDRADLDDALDLAQNLTRFSERDSNPDKVALAQRALGSTRMNRGELHDAMIAFDACIATSGQNPTAFPIREYGEAPMVIAHQYKGWVCALMGRLDQGAELGLKAVDQARQLNYPLTLAFSLHTLAVIHLMRREYELCRSAGEEVLDLSNEHDFVFWSAGSRVLIGSALAHLGRIGEGLDMASQAISDWRATGADLHVPTWVSYLADAAVLADDHESAAPTVADAIDLAREKRDLIALAELLRLNGRIAARRGDPAAEGLLESAIETASAQGALLYELRAAADLAHLRGSNGALDALTRTYAKFDEGLSLQDLQDAKSLIGAAA